MKAINLKTEYLINPIGIDIEHPRLFWNCDIGVKQTAYRIVAAAEGATVWGQRQGFLPVNAGGLPSLAEFPPKSYMESLALGRKR